MIKFLITLFFIFSTKAFAWQNDMSLKGGLGLSQATIHAFDKSEDHMTGFGFNTQFGYRFSKWEINLASYFYWGKIDDLRFRANGTSVVGSGVFRHVSFGPVFKYIFEWQPKKGWHFYAGLGPTWSMQTVKLEQFQASSGDFNSDYKLTYISRGGMLAIGIEELLPFKEMHPVYFEILYSYKKSKDVSLVDASNFAEVRTISTEESEQDIRGSFIMINAGITLF
ncbi:MAG: hypothetical protein CME70_22885 [Halobacteriovorax sp.]|nr:hypothetical protein [Halobacteriovorax sp.]|tara:strand:- start:1512 stop:2183 length:672 start_codon:yes stop_codon:yes gene_type:complete